MSGLCVSAGKFAIAHFLIALPFTSSIRCHPLGAFRRDRDVHRNPKKCRWVSSFADRAQQERCTVSRIMTVASLIVEPQSRELSEATTRTVDARQPHGRAVWAASTPFLGAEADVNSDTLSMDMDLLLENDPSAAGVHHEPSTNRVSSGSGRLPVCFHSTTQQWAGSGFLKLQSGQQSWWRPVSSATSTNATLTIVFNESISIKDGRSGYSRTIFSTSGASFPRQRKGSGR